MLIAGIFIFHFCGMFPYETVPGVGHLLVGAFFMLSGLGLMESFKNKKNYLDDFIGKKTARQGRYSLPRDPHYYGVISRINKNDPYAMITEDRKLFTGSAEKGSMGKKGKKALTAVEQNFEKSHISDLNLKDVLYEGRKVYPDIAAKKRLKEISNK